MFKNEEGFSLLELVVAVGVAGIIAAVALPTFAGLQDKATTTSATYAASASAAEALANSTIGTSGSVNSGASSYTGSSSSSSAAPYVLPSAIFYGWNAGSAALNASFITSLNPQYAESYAADTVYVTIIDNATGYWVDIAASASYKTTAYDPAVGGSVSTTPHVNINYGYGYASDSLGASDYSSVMANLASKLPNFTYAITDAVPSPNRITIYVN